MTSDIAKRFWAKVRKAGPDECWLWTASKDRKGYGQININKRPVGAHRVSYMLEHGSIPDGLNVLHRCDNPPCVNPMHLFVGTTKDNIHDMLAKGRHRPGRFPGEKNPKVKLTEGQVLEIRSLAASGWTQKQLMVRFGMCSASISNIVAGRSWKHLLIVSESALTVTDSCGIIPPTRRRGAGCP